MTEFGFDAIAAAADRRFWSQVPTMFPHPTVAEETTDVIAGRSCPKCLTRRNELGRCACRVRASR